ncbi:hypothetical protein F5Y04DRAFT_289218 [Hypomontagnella monticulosa]|nr:hypothetical protein F5Y04DRAFT_289218 [Hypomontagnella monticulosa]
MARRGILLSITESVPPSALLDFVVCIISPSIALFWVALRVAARIHSRTKLRFNDYAIFWAMFWGLCLAVNSIVTVSYGGIGHHMSEIMALAPDNIQPMLKTVLIGQFTWALSNTGVKLSIVDLYVKLFGTNRNFRLTACCLMGAVVAYCLMVIFMAFFLCQPFAFNWDVTIPGGHCRDQGSAFLASGVLNLILDIAVIMLPLPMLGSLNMPMNKKLGLMLMFSVGVGICGITIWRTIIIRNLDTEDIFYDIGYLSAATNLEPLLGICVACLPICRSLLIAYARTFRNASSSALSRVGLGSPTQSGSQAPGDPTNNEGVIGRSAQSTDRKHFKRLYDTIYPMTDLTSTTQIEGGTGNDSLEIASGSQWNHGIKITETWNVATERQT